jgi:hypothetical protein
MSVQQSKDADIRGKLLLSNRKQNDHGFLVFATAI